MNKTFRYKFLLGLIIVAALLNLAPAPAFAAANSAKLAPASGASQPGNTFTVSVDGHASGGWWYSTSSVNGTLNFPANLLKVNSVSTTGTSFPSSASVTPNNTTGVITFSGTCSGWFCGYSNKDVHFFTVTFESIAPGTANVNFGSVNYNSGAAATTGGVYTISAPPPPPAPSPTPTPKPSATPKPTPKPSATPKPSVQPSPTPTPTPSAEEVPTPETDSDGGLKVQDVKITTNRSESRITWTVSDTDDVDAVSTTLTYGLSKGSQPEKPTVTKLDNGSYEVVLKDLKPGTLYHFAIKAAASNNLQGGSYSGTLTTRGYPVQLTIQQNNLLLPGAKIRINERTFVANKDGIITTELSDGEHTAQVTPAGSDESYPVKFAVAKKTIPSNGNPDLQSFILNVSTIGSTSGVNSQLLWSLIGAIGAAVAVIGGIVGFIVIRKRQQSGDLQQSPEVDTDMLAASYGRPAETLYQNMPAPNLETQGGGVGGIFQDQPLQQPLSDPTLLTTAPNEAYLDPTLADQQVVANPYIAPDQLAPTPDGSAIDPASLPLPSDNPSLATDSDVPATTYTDEEQLASELIQVESSSGIQQPDAVYNEATGELDILHGNERANTMTEPELDAPVQDEATVESVDEPNEQTNDLDIDHNRPNDSEPLPQASIGVAH